MDMILNEMKCIQGMSIIDVYAVECEGVTYNTKTFINGRFKRELESSDGYGVDAPDEAIRLTKELIEEVKAEYKNIWLRIGPELREIDGKYYCRVRLAF